MDNSNKKLAINRSNSLDMTSKFSSYSNKNELDAQRLSLIKNKFQPLVLHAERKFHYESMGSIIKNLSNNENSDILKGKETLLKEKAINHIKRSNSFIATNIPYFLEQNKNEIETTNKNIINKKKSLNIQRLNSFSTNNMDILNKDYFKNKTQNFNDNKNIYFGNFMIFNNNNGYNSKETFGNTYNINNNTGNGNLNITAKEKNFAEKKNLKLLNLKNMILQQEQLSIKSKPGIDSGSMKIINNKLKDKKPIYERFEEIKNEKKAKLEKYKKELIRTNSAKNLSSSNYSEFNQSSKKEIKMNFDNSSNYSFINSKKNLKNQIDKEKPDKHFQEWLVNNERWRGQKAKKFIDLKKRIEKEKMDFENSEITHTPRIDQLSDLIANTKNFNEFPGVEIHDKLYNLKDIKISKKKYLEEKTKPRFTPLINNYTPKYFCSAKKSAKAIDKKLYINEVFGANLDLLNNSFKESQTRKSQDNGFFWRSKLYDHVNEDCGAYERKFDVNVSSSCVRKGSLQFMFTLNDKKMKSFSQEKINPKTGEKYKSDLTFFEQNQNNKLIFYN